MLKPNAELKFFHSAVIQILKKRKTFLVTLALWQLSNDWPFTTEFEDVFCNTLPDYTYLPFSFVLPLLLDGCKNRCCRNSGGVR